MKRLRHPGIIRIRDSFEEADGTYVLLPRVLPLTLAKKNLVEDDFIMGLFDLAVRFDFADIECYKLFRTKWIYSYKSFRRNYLCRCKRLLFFMLIDRWKVDDRQSRIYNCVQRC